MRTAKRLPDAIMRVTESSISRPDVELGVIHDAPASAQLLIVSDLHRCTRGHPDWPKRQGTDTIYQAMLQHYGTDGWHLCENGDVDDFWMSGGSPEGSAYDMLRMAGSALSAAGRDSLLDDTYVRQLDEIIANNQVTYDLIDRLFASQGRYLRTIGNHDDPMARASLRDRLAQRLHGVRPAEAVVLRNADAEVEAIICHGHMTDGWNAPGRDMLGKISTWVSSTLTDIPFIPAPHGLPSRAATAAVMNGKATNRLVEVHPTFGASTNYDSLDEEVLFLALAPKADSPWLFMGHTHYPMISPTSANGEAWARYANSGSGIVPDLVTGIEWDGTGADPSVRLVAWTWSSIAPHGAEVMATIDGRDLCRFELVASREAPVLIAQVEPSLSAGMAEPT